MSVTLRRGWQIREAWNGHVSSDGCSYLLNCRGYPQKLLSERVRTLAKKSAKSSTNAAPKQTEEEKLYDVLRQALRVAPPVRVYSLGKKQPPDEPFLLPGRAAANKKLIDALLNHEPPLLVVEHEEKAGKTIHQLVRVTADGVSWVVGRTSGAGEIALLDQAHEHYALQIAEQVVERSRQDLEFLQRNLGDFIEAIQRQVDARAVSLQKAQERHQQVVSVVEGLQRKHALSKEPAEMPAKPERLQAPESNSAQVKRIAQEVVLLWETAEDAKSRQGLEQILVNSGIKRIGRVGEEISFAAHLHKCPGAFPGDTVRIVRPGWEFSSEGSTQLLGKAEAELMP